MRRSAFAFLLAVAAAIALGSASEGVKAALHTHGTMHPWVHLIAFALVSIAAVLCTRSGWLRALLLLGVLLLAWGTEYREHLLDGWPIEQTDVQQDVLGTVAGGALGWVLSRLRSRSDQRLV